MALWFESALLEDGWHDAVRVTLDGARIGSLSAGAALEPGDTRHGAAIPGLPNLHSHAFQRAMAGMTEVRGPGADSFWTWRTAMYRFVDRLDPEGMRDIAALAYIEMLESGFTRVGEFHYLHHAPDGGRYGDPAAMAAAIGEAAAETGIALTLLPVFYAHSDFGGAPPSDAQRRFVSDLDGFGDLFERCRGIAGGLDGGITGVAPHSLRAVTLEELRAIALLAADAPIHIHAAEQTAEVHACLAWCGARPVELLLGEGGAGPNWCLVHATHMSDAEIRALAASGAVAGLCPVTEANLGDGVFPAVDYLAAGGAFGVGSDSNVAIDAAQELRMLEYSQRLAHRGRNLLAESGGSTGAALRARATAGGAQALGAALPSIAAGAPADLVSFKQGFPAMARGDSLLDSWIFAGNPDHIDGVWRAGKRLVTGGRHIARDAIAARYAACLERLTA